MRSETVLKTREKRTGSQRYIIMLSKTESDIQSSQGFGCSMCFSGGGYAGDVLMKGGVIRLCDEVQASIIYPAESCSRPAVNPKRILQRCGRSTCFFPFFLSETVGEPYLSPCAPALFPHWKAFFCFFLRNQLDFYAESGYIKFMYLLRHSSVGRVGGC